MFLHPASPRAMRHPVGDPASMKFRVRALGLLILAGVLALQPTLGAWAIEVPPTGSVVYIQTNGPAAPIGRGDWYTSTANGTGAGYHYFTINIPAGWPSATPVQIDLYSPEMH